MNTATATLGTDARIIGLVSVAHLFSHFYQLVIPALFLQMRDSFGASYTQLGLAMSAFFVVSGAMQTPAGFLVDRIGGRAVMLGGLGLLAGGILLVGFAPSLPFVAAALILAGLGNSVFHPADLAILNHKITPRRLGHAFGIHGIGGYVGWAMAPVFSIAIASALGWRFAPIIAGTAGLVVLALLATQQVLITHDEASVRRRAAASEGLDQSLAVLLSWPIVACFLFFFMSAIALAGFQNYSIPVIEHLYHAPLGIASAALTGFLLGGAGGFVAGGFIASVTQRHGLVASSGAFAAACLFVVMAAGWVPVWGLVVIATCAGFLLGMISPSRDIIVRASTPAHARGKAYGFVYSGLDLGAALAPAMFGWLMDHDRPALIFVTIAGFMVAAGAMVGDAGRRRVAAAAG